jgi:hypothetical protein
MPSMKDFLPLTGEASLYRYLSAPDLAFPSRFTIKNERSIVKVFLDFKV